MKRGRKDDLLTMTILLSWALSYLVCALMKPDLIGNLPPFWSCQVMAYVGTLLLLALVLELLDEPVISCLLYALLGMFEVIGFVGSWTGVLIWRPALFGAQPEYQISMAVFDWVAAITLFYRMGRCWEEDSTFEEVKRD